MRSADFRFTIFNPVHTHTHTHARGQSLGKSHYNNNPTLYFLNKINVVRSAQFASILVKLNRTPIDISID